MTTMREVARLAGVSASTVSRALSGHPYVEAELRERIRALADELGYRPNPLARGLRSSRSNTIGLIIPDVFNPSYYGIAGVLQSRLRDLGYGLLLEVTNNDRETDRRCLAHFYEQHVAGIFYVPSSATTPVTVDERAADVPLVELFRRTTSSPFDGIVHDEDVGAHRIAEHLVGLGHERIGMIAGPRGYSTTRRRVNGALDALRAAGRDPGLLRVVHREYSVPGGERGFDELLDLRPAPTAVIAASSHFVLGALLAARRRGVTIPRQLSLAGMGDPDWYQVAQAPVTTYAFPIRELGLLAAHLLVSRLDQVDPRERPTQIVVSGTLLKRESTGAPPRSRAPSKRRGRAR
ncbi:LacI family DNA-binding transcriptional regulator [Streptomyces sp. NPDC050560]|uniref:LacI family DNA-binding transcriptional regulator n=1 Tax=Streptomyces sp. NPDC050560 TaxID=3365630 RepID=UPI0037923867